MIHISSEIGSHHYHCRLIYYFWKLSCRNAQFRKPRPWLQASHRVTKRRKWRLKTPLPVHRKLRPAGSAVRVRSDRVYARRLQKWIGDFLNVESPFPRDCESRRGPRRRIGVASLSPHLIDAVLWKRECRVRPDGHADTLKNHGHWPVYKNRCRLIRRVNK